MGSRCCLARQAARAHMAAGRHGQQMLLGMSGCTRPLGRARMRQAGRHMCSKCCSVCQDAHGGEVQRLSPCALGRARMRQTWAATSAQCVLDVEEMPL
eukprot:1140142-Pelagomonas_calceolata.AAC.4